MQIEYFQSFKLENRIAYLKEDLSNAWDFYLLSYLNYVFRINSEVVKKDDIPEGVELNAIFKDLPKKKCSKEDILKALYQNVQEPRPSNFPLYNCSEDYLYNYPIWLAFYQEESEQAKELNSTFQPKSQQYVKFLQTIKSKIRNLQFFLYRNNYNNRSIKFKDYAKPKLGEDFIDLENYEALLNTLMRELDYYYRQEHLFRQKEISNKEAWQKINTLFKYEQHASPIVFIEYNKELIIYKRLLKNWLLMEVEKRKRQFEWENIKVPEPYFAITQYANRLLDPREKEYLIKDSPEFYQYPKHIFASFKAYSLFKHYMPSIINQARLTFIYRYMRQIEKTDYKILVDPAPFLDWYDGNKSNPDVFEIKQGLEKVRNKERVKDYEVIKNLIEELYPTG